MSRLMAAVAVTAVLGAALATGAGASVTAAKTVSNEKYAKQLCGRLQDYLAEVDALKEPDVSDPAAYQTQTLASVDKLTAQLKAAQTKLKKVSPEDGGKKITKLFDKYLADLQTEFQSARDTFAAADPSSPAFSGAVTVLGVSLSTSNVKVGDPFSKLSGNQDLLGALGDEKSCKDIVTVIGG
jgi:hypothetical protein